MKRTTSLLLRAGWALAALLLLSGCSLTNKLFQAARGAAGQASGQPSATQAAKASVSASSGEAVLPDPGAGLAALKAYRAVLTIASTGSLDGQPFQRSTRLEITRAASGDFDSLAQSSDGPQTARLLALGGAYYRWSGANPACQGSVDPPGEDEVIEPATLLPPLGAAVRVGVEQVRQVSAVHYHFDQTALPRFKTADGVTGEVWVAQEDGYILRYQLTAAAPQQPSGKGLEVSQTYTYDLTPASPAPTLPGDCAAVPVDLPVPDGAQAVSRANGLVSFQTAAQPRAVLDFYAQSLPPLGWKAETAAPGGDVTLPAFIDFSQDGQRLTVSLTANEDQTTAVTLTLVDAAAQAAQPPPPTPTPAGSPTPAPTIDPSQSGLPDKVPLYPGATNLVKAGGAAMFESGDSWNAVAAFYREQLANLGWTAGTETALDNGVSMMWNQDGKLLILTILSADGQTRVVVMEQ